MISLDVKLTVSYFTGWPSLDVKITSPWTNGAPVPQVEAGAMDAKMHDLPMSPGELSTDVCSNLILINSL